MKLSFKVIFSWTLFISVVFANGNEFKPTFANQTSFLRFANDNLGGLNNLTDFFNINAVAQQGHTRANVSTEDLPKGLVLTTGTGQATSVFLKERMAADIANPGFSTYFVMNIYRLNTALPADGYVFVVAADANSLGSAGGGLGYQGINNSLGIEFDFYNNGNGSMSSPIELVPAADVFKNGALPVTKGVNFDATFKIDRWDVSSFNLKRAYHTWIEYDAKNTRLELRVAPSDFEDPSQNRPARPAQPLISQTIALPEISQYFYAGFTAATGGQAQQMSLKSWFISNAYIPGGINPGQSTYIVDNQPPTPPTMSGQSVGSQYELTISGGSDAESSVAGYQYKALDGNWTNYTGPTTISSVGTYQARSVDNAGNFSTAVSATLNDVRFSVNQTIVHTIKRLNLDPGLEVFYVYEDATYQVNEWYLDAQFNGNPVSILQPQATTITLYGKPIRVAFDLDFVLDGGVFNVAPPTTFRIEGPIQIPQPTKEGYEFGGWYLDEELTLPYLTTFLPSQNLMLFAGWTIQSYQLTLFDINDSDAPLEISLVYQSPIDPILSSVIPVKTGYTFEGWYLDSEGEVAYLEQTSMPANQLDVYAIWSINRYQIQFQLDPEVIWFQQTQNYNELVIFPSDPTRYGYEFTGWSLQSEIVTYGATVPANDLTLVATWANINFSIEIFLDENVTLEPGSHSYMTPLIEILPESVNKEGHQFLGWFLDDTFETPVTESTLLDSNTRVFARWQINQYLLKMYTLPNQEPIDLKEVTFGEAPELPNNLIRDGYDFLGWKDAAGNWIDENWIMPADTVELFASWLGLSGQMIFIYGNESTSRTFTSGEIVGGLPELPVKEGYRFVGWSTTPHDIAGLIDEAALVTNGQTIIVYPIWEKIDTPSSTPANSNTITKTTISDSHTLTVSIWIMGLITLSAIVGFLYYGLKRKTYANY
jgi:uncharacterized repeat protein (TIGR02543 family)